MTRRRAPRRALVRPAPGQRYGDWLVLEPAPSRAYERASDGRRCAHRYWRCRCVCGEALPVSELNLQLGRTRCCGACAAYRRELAKRAA